MTRSISRRALLYGMAPDFNVDLTQNDAEVSNVDDSDYVPTSDSSSSDTEWTCSELEHGSDSESEDELAELEDEEQFFPSVPPDVGGRTREANEPVTEELKKVKQTISITHASTIDASLHASRMACASVDRVPSRPV